MMKLRVYHTGYGCDTGCCGHVFEFSGEGAAEVNKRFDFQFEHPYLESTDANYIEFAKRIVKERAPECYDSIDWTTVNVEEVRDD